MHFSKKMAELLMNIFAVPLSSLLIFLKVLFPGGGNILCFD